MIPQPPEERPPPEAAERKGLSNKALVAGLAVALLCALLGVVVVVYLALLVRIFDLIA